MFLSFSMKPFIILFIGIVFLSATPLNANEHLPITAATTTRECWYNTVRASISTATYDPLLGENAGRAAGVFFPDIERAANYMIDTLGIDGGLAAHALASAVAYCGWN